MTVLAISALALTGCSGASSTPSAAPTADVSASATPSATATHTVTPAAAPALVELAAAGISPEDEAKIDASVAKLDNCLKAQLGLGVFTKQAGVAGQSAQQLAVINLTVTKLHAQVARLGCK